MVTTLIATLGGLELMAALNDVRSDAPADTSNSSLYVNATFENGTRGAGKDPLSVSWYSMNGPGTDLTIVDDDGPGGIRSGKALNITPTGASEGIVAQFPVPATLMDGQSISLKFKFRFVDNTNTNQAGLFRFGLLDSRGTPTAPPAGTGDNDAISRIDDRGYFAATNPGKGDDGGTTIYRWGSPLSTGTMNYDPTLKGGDPLETIKPRASIDCHTEPHTASLVITRRGKTLSFAAAIDGEAAATGSESAPLTYVFDSIAIANAGEPIHSSFVIDNVQVQYSISASKVYPGFGIFVDSGKGAFDDVWTQHYNAVLSGLGITTCYFMPNFCDGSPLHGQSGSMTSSAQYEGGSQWGNTLAQKLVPIASIPLANSASRGNEVATKADFDDIVAGKYDDDYKLVLAAYSAGKWPIIYLRIGWEQNDPGSNYPWYAGEDADVAAKYVAAWKHVANLAHDYAQSHNVVIKTVWCPAVVNYCPVGPTATYPINDGAAPGSSGDQYVDLIGIDVYLPCYLSGDGNGKFRDFGGNAEADSAGQVLTGPGGAVNRAHWLDYPGASVWTPNSPGGAGLAYALDLAQQHNKPFCIPETGGNADDTTNGIKDDPILPLYLANRMSQAIARGTPVEFVAAWNGYGGFIFTDGTRPKQLAAWKEFLKEMAAVSP